MRNHRSAEPSQETCLNAFRLCSLRLKETGVIGAGILFPLCRPQTHFISVASEAFAFRETIMLRPFRTGSKRCLRFRPTVLLFVCLLAGCRTSVQPVPSDGSSHNFTDEIGRQVTIKSNPQRIISLAPSVTEILFALGLAERIIGVTTYCDYPAAAKTKEPVGDTLNPNLERIIALKPDLVIITTASQLEKLTRQLDQLQIPVYVTNPRTVPEVIYSLRHLGDITGTTERAEQITREMEHRMAAVAQQVKGEPSVRVLYVLQNAPLITAGRQTFINDLITLAGGVSISDTEQADYPQFSRETVIARNPEVIIIPASHGTELVNAAEVRRDFAVTAAVKQNRIVSINPDLTSRPGPRIIDGLEQLATKIHAAGQSAEVR